MISKAIYGSVKKTSLKKIRLHKGEYDWDDAWVLVMNYGPTMLYLILKFINPASRIGVPNLKYEIDKVTLAKLGNNVKYLLDEMYSN